MSDADIDIDSLPDLSDLEEDDRPFHIFCVSCFPRDDKPRISYCGKMHPPRNIYKTPPEQWRKGDRLPGGVKFCEDCVRIRPNCMKCKRK